MAEQGRRNSRSKWILAGLILLIAVFLAGFIPQYRNSVHAEEELRNRDQQLSELRRQATLSKMRDLASLLYLDVTRKNYGIGQQRAGSLFDLVRSIMNNTSDATLKSGLENILAKRDDIVAKLAKQDAQVETDVQSLLDQLFQLTFR